MQNYRDRLIELLAQKQDYGVEFGDHMETINNDVLADYLIANGVIVPPCKVGDTVYYFSCYFGTILPYFVENLNIAYLGEKGENCVYTFEANCNHENELLDSIDFESDDIGKTVFLTREEAEKALEEKK